MDTVDTLSPSAYLAALRAEGAALAAASRAGLEEAVPACPGWTVADLVNHMIDVYRGKAHVLRHHLREAPPREHWQLPSRPDGPSLVDAYEVELAALVDALRQAGPAEAAWTWYPPDQTAGFWYRRMAQETAVHRVDAQAAHGPAAPVDAELAADGVDELVSVMLHGERAASEGARVTIHLHATDTAGEWVVGFGGGDLAVARAHAQADAAVRGPASDLLLWAWGRRGREGLEAMGDVSVVDRFRGVVAQAT